STYVFKLKPGVKWHNIAPVNGRELVADDVVYSYQRIIDLKANAAILANVIKIEAPDKASVKLTLGKPNADLLANLGGLQGKIVPRELGERNGGLEGPPAIGTGPWIYEKWEQGQGFAATRNREYFQKGQPYVDRIETFRSADATTGFNAFRTGTNNVLGTFLL